MCKADRKEKTTPFGVNLMRSQVLYRAAQEQQTANRMLLTHQSARADGPPHSPIILYLWSMLQCHQVLTADKQSDIGLWSTGGWCQGGSSFTMVQ